MYKIAALYRFVSLSDIPAMRKRIYDLAETMPEICGTLLLAPEGINGTIAAHPQNMDTMIDFLDNLCGVKQGELKYAETDKAPFNRLKVRPKKEIITMKCPDADPNVMVGKYIEPEEWNDLLNDPEVVLVDTRNDYEVKLGTFEKAVDPDLHIFSEFPEWVEKNMDAKKHKKVAMFCTGGIRCEKASSYMLAQGFEEVYHLKGGILKYLETIPAEQSKWEGECFVFDQRVSVGHGLEQGDYKICHGCREPLAPEDMNHKSYEEGVSCKHCIDRLSADRAEALRERHAHYKQQSQN